MNKCHTNFRCSLADSPFYGGHSYSSDPFRDPLSQSQMLFKLVVWSLCGATFPYLTGLLAFWWKSFLCRYTQDQFPVHSTSLGYLIAKWSFHQAFYCIFLNSLTLQLCANFTFTLFVIFLKISVIIQSFELKARPFKNPFFLLKPYEIAGMISSPTEMLH